MSSAIPSYPLKDSNGNVVLSTNKRFNHPWYTSKKLDFVDNLSHDDLASPTPADNNGLASVLSPWPANL